MSEPARKPGPRFEARREEVIQHAAALFAERGYAATSVADIGAAARVGKGTLYYYIGSKEQVLADIHERAMAPLMRDCGDIVDLTANAYVRLRLVSEAILAAIESSGNLIYVSLHEYKALTGDLAQRFRDQRDEFEGLIAALLEDGQQAGIFGFEDLRLTVLAFLNLHNHSYHWLRPDGPMTAVEISARFSQIFFGGVGTSDLATHDWHDELDCARQQLHAAERPRKPGSGGNR